MENAAAGRHLLSQWPGILGRERHREDTALVSVLSVSLDRLLPLNSLVVGLSWCKASSPSWELPWHPWGPFLQRVLLEGLAGIVKFGCHLLFGQTRKLGWKINSQRLHSHCFCSVNPGGCSGESLKLQRSAKDVYGESRFCRAAGLFTDFQYLLQFKYTVCK